MLQNYRLRSFIYKYISIEHRYVERMHYKLTAMSLFEFPNNIHTSVCIFVGL